jgi:L-threonylcarbamoyladenylate synthase
MAAKLLCEMDPDALPTAIRTINTGGIVAFPTDTVYGIGVSAFNVTSIKNLFLAKGRDNDKAIAILLSEMGQLSTVSSSIPDYAIQLGKVFWPGGLTLVVPRHPEIPEILSPLPTIGVRVPNHSFALGLIRACGPLAVTSANISGKPNATSAFEVEQQLSNQVDLIIDGGPSLGGTASTVVDCTGSTCRILRAGAITPEQIFQIIQS